MSALELTNLGITPKLGFKGPGAESWLREQGIDVPPAIYDTRRLADGGTIVRLGGSDFLLEFASGSEMGKPPVGVYRVERQDVVFLLRGAESVKCLAQLSSFDFRTAPPGRVILTRAAVVNCMVLPEAGEIPSFRIWIDGTFALYFWETLNQIAADR